MMIKKSLFVLVGLAVVILYVTIPVSHRVLTGWDSSTSSSPSSFFNGKRNKKQQLISATTASSEGHDQHDQEAKSVHVGDSGVTKFPQIFPEQMEPTQISPQDLAGEFRNPYKSMVDDVAAESRTENILSKLMNRSKPFVKKKCTELKYTEGKWIRRAKPPRLVYPALGEILGCCERGFVRDKQQHRHQNHHHQSQNHQESPSPPRSAHEPADSSASSSSLSSSYEVINNISMGNEFREELYYEWVPNDCELIPWDEELFCRALRGRDIMFAGDSLNDHWHASLYYLLGGRKDIYKYEGTIQGKKRCKGHPICAKYYKKPLKLHHLTNQYLAEGSLRNRNYKWWRPIRKYPILVLNAGSWMRDVMDEKIAVPDEKWRSLMTKALGLVRREQYNGTIVWRTTYAGHPFCWNYKEPLDAPLRKNEFPNVNPYNKYRWETIPERNKFTTKLWSDAGAHILDVERITDMMPLGHLGKNHPKYVVSKNATDCLHYCSPGPVYDTWSQLLMNLLLGNI